MGLNPLGWQAQNSRTVNQHARIFYLVTQKVFTTEDFEERKQINYNFNIIFLLFFNRKLVLALLRCSVTYTL